MMPHTMDQLAQSPPQRQLPNVVREMSDKTNRIIACWQDWAGSGIEHLS